MTFVLIALSTYIIPVLIDVPSTKVIPFPSPVSCRPTHHCCRGGTPREVRLLISLLRKFWKKKNTLYFTICHYSSYNKLIRYNESRMRGINLLSYSCNLRETIKNKTCGIPAEDVVTKIYIHYQG